MRRLRFGLLAVFATMLVVIGVAGWARSELDLYREEQAILAELAKAGCTAYAFRGKLESATIYRRRQEGFAWYEPEWLTRMTDLQVNGDPPERLRRRAAALPTLQSLRIFAIDPQSPRRDSDPRPQAFPPSSELLGRPLPEFREPTIDEARLSAPLPDGETLSDADREALLAEIRISWSSESPRLPSRYIKRIERNDRWYSPARIDLLRDGERYWSVQQNPTPFDVEESLLTFRNDEAEYGLAYRDSAWELARRGDEGIDPMWAQRMALQFSKIDLPRADAPQLFPRMAILDHVERIARVDEDRVRLDVKPATLQADPMLVSDLSYDVEEMTLVLRQDMDWAVSAERSKMARLYSNTRDPAQPIVYERALERRQGFVLLTEELALIPYAKGPLGIMTAEGSETARTRYAWELDPVLDPGIFDPNRYLDEPLPSRARPFPWFAVPFAIGAGMLAILIVRNGWLLLRSRARPAKIEPAPAES